MSQLELNPWCSSNILYREACSDDCSPYFRHHLNVVWVRNYLPSSGAPKSCCLLFSLIKTRRMSWHHCLREKEKKIQAVISVFKREEFWKDSWESANYNNSKGNSELFPHSCYMWLYTWRLKKTAPFSFIIFFYTQLFYLMLKKENPEELFPKKGQPEQTTILVQGVFI